MTSEGPKMTNSDCRRFWEKVDRGEDDECWPWTGAKWGDYGWFWLPTGPQGAHRASFLAENGYLPPVVRHTCDNPICVNPQHLLPGTQLDNVADMVERERYVRGAQATGAKLTKELVRQIRHVHGNKSQAELARIFGVGRCAIHLIVHNQRWAWVDQEDAA